MDPKGLLSLNFLLFFSLAFELSCVTVEDLTKCPTIREQLGSSLLLPLIPQGMSKSMNKRIHIIVTKAESPGNSVKKKIVSLDLPKGGSLPYLEDGYKFHLENWNLGILESKKENEGWYFLTLEGNVSVQHFCLQLELYERISTPEIKVLNLTQENGNCSLMLTCEVEKGDHVAFSWSKEAGTHPLIIANGSHLLYLTLGPQHANSTYICTASNPISNGSQIVIPWSRCRSYPSGLVGSTQLFAWKDNNSTISRQWGLYAGLFLGGIIGVTMILLVVILLLTRRGKANYHQPTVEAKSLTIYAEVQKSGPIQKEHDPLPAQDPCTTIYVAATEPVPQPVQEPSSITVYASVTLPES